MTESEFFAFKHGIYLVLKAHGQEIQDRDAVMPIFKQMQGILASPRNSLVQAHDSIPTDKFESRRKLESELCQAYLDGATAKSGEHE